MVNMNLKTIGRTLFYSVLIGAGGTLLVGYFYPMATPVNLILASALAGFVANRV